MGSIGRTLERGQIKWVSERMEILVLITEF
jgi:hypothetical protein